MWTLLVELALVQIVLQMRLYVLYNRSNRLLFVMVSGFVIEFAVALVTAVQSSIFDVNIVSIPTASVTAFPTTEEIYIYIGYSAMVAYELLLFSLALWAGIRLSRCPFPENRIGARRLTAILIQGNVTYFLAIWLCLLVYLAVSLTASAQYLGVTTNLVFSLLCIAGCRIILDIRSAVSPLCTSATISQHDSRARNYSLVVFRDSTTHDSIYDDTT
ncbi:hypothetical protein SCLCIDRAFT_280149 [Scleroderma citrinum Foug A]|uniref:Uncharacterized protein n=1 Tax=Scleroderma citrinum Foug A TaxID=1036808 RepID=A0A0C2ZTG6_9AGAM|nr:hypothetical protein SCLCIDRAFT_280149 [Scleroderma citrinum Foug A]